MARLRRPRHAAARAVTDLLKRGILSPRRSISAAGAVSLHASKVSSASSSRSTPLQQDHDPAESTEVNWTSNVSGRSATSASCSEIVCLRPTVRVGSHR